MKGKVLFLSVFLWRTVCSEYCQAVQFMCKPKLVTQHTSKHIARWLQKVQAMPDCFLGEERETVQLEDGSVEVMTQDKPLVCTKLLLRLGSPSHTWQNTIPGHA